MKHRWMTFTLVLAALVAFTGPALGNFFDGGGDGTNWSDNVNWSDDIIPLTATGDLRRCRHPFAPARGYQRRLHRARRRDRRYVRGRNRWELLQYPFIRHQS